MNKSGFIAGLLHKFAGCKDALINKSLECSHAVGKSIELQQRIEFILGVTKTNIDIIDPEFNIIYVDPAWRKIYGDPKGRKCYEYFANRTRVCPGCGIRRALETKTTVVTEEVLPKEGNRPIQVTTTPFQNEKGEWFVAEVNVDISERKQAEQDIRRAKYDLERLVRERTVEATQAAEAAKQKAEEVAKAYEALKEKTEILERFQKVTVDREFQMIKLKEELNSLLVELGRPKKYNTPQGA